MNLVTITEEDGTKTRMSIGADNVAVEVAHFYRKIIKLSATLENVDELVSTDEEEATRANRYMKEWRMFGKGLIAVK
jgi:hypothetical protein